MEHLQNGYTLDTPGGTFPLSTDSMLLADFIRLPRDASVLDLGAGCGTLGLLLCAKDTGCAVTGIELTEDAHTAALENIRRNGLQQRLQSIQGDLRTYAGGLFDCCVSNPPYFSGGPASRQTPLARREDLCNPEELFAAASRNLKYGGDFFLVHKPERLAQLIACGAKENLEAKRLLLVRHNEGSEISLILLQFRKGGKPGLIIEEATLFDNENNPTDFYKTVYHL
jgi:tRNA1Val (adenine37-N6)-methyltransferase